MTSALRVSAVREYLRGSLWFYPTVAVTAALVSGSLLVGVDLPRDSLPAAVLFGGGADGARGLLEAVAGSTITGRGGHVLADGRGARERVEPVLASGAAHVPA